MTDKKSIDSRRKLLKSIAAGSGAVVAGKTLPESWSKPVVDAVMLPAHAETSDTNESAPVTPQEPMCNNCTASIELDQNNTGAYIFTGSRCFFDTNPFSSRTNPDRLFLFADNSAGVVIIEDTGENWSQSGVSGRTVVGGTTNGEETRRFTQTLTRKSTGEQYTVEFSVYRTGDSTTNFLGIITIICTTGPI